MSTFKFAEHYGSGAGTKADTDYLNLLAANIASGSDTTTTPSANPIALPTSGTNYSFERWFQAHFTGTFTSITALKLYKPTRVFTVTAANATVGATYTNNGMTFTVVATIAGGTTLVCTTSGGDSEASGTLTKASGSGDSTITFSAVTNGLPTGITIKCGTTGGTSYTAAVNTESAVATADIPTTSDTALSVGPASIVAAGYSNYCVAQLHVASTASNGVLPTQTFRFFWQEV
jgi:hypothetical protein